MPTLPCARRYTNRISAAGSSTDVDDLIPGMHTMRASKVVYASHMVTEGAGTAGNSDTCSTTAHSSAWAVAVAAAAAVAALVVVALGLYRC